MAGVFDHRLRPVPSPVYDRPNPRRGSSHDVPCGARQRNIPHDEPRLPPNTGAGSAPWPNFEHRTDGQRTDAAGSDPDRRRRRMGRRPVGRRGHGGRLRCPHAGGARRQTTDLEPVDPEDLQALRTPYEELQPTPPPLITVSTIIRVAPCRYWIEKANRKQTIFNSKPLGVTAWIFLANKVVSRLKTVSMCWRIGFPRNSSHAGSGRLGSSCAGLLGAHRSL